MKASRVLRNVENIFSAFILHLSWGKHLREPATSVFDQCSGQAINLYTRTSHASPASGCDGVNCQAILLAELRRDPPSARAGQEAKADSTQRTQ